jgi:hypothetical protein
MVANRRRRGFERVGRLPAAELGLPRKRARELVLSAEWSRVAGEAIARRARAVGVHRGVLEIRVEDERWRQTLRSLIPRLAGRLAARCPELRLRKVVLLGSEQEPSESPLAIAAPDEGTPDEPAPVRGARSEAAAESPCARSAVERLESAKERYLERSARRGSPGGLHRP